MPSKFGALAVDTQSTSRMPIVLPGEVDPVTDDSAGFDDKGNPLPGVEAYIEFLPWDSEPGRAFDRAKNKDAVRKGFRQRSKAELREEAENADVIMEQAERLSVLATGWHLVGIDRKVIDIPFSKENALDLFSSPETAWLRRISFVFVANEANFMKSSSTTS